MPEIAIKPALQSRYNNKSIIFSAEAPGKYVTIRKSIFHHQKGEKRNRA